MKKQNEVQVEVQTIDEIQDLRNNNNSSKKTNGKKMEDAVPKIKLEKVDLEEDTTKETKKETKQTNKKGSFAKFLNLREKQEKRIISDDAKKSRGYAWLAYILFFIPLCINKNNSFVRFHSNEGLELNLVDLVAIILTLLGALIKPSTILTVLFTIFGVGLLFLTSLTKLLMIFTSIKGIQKESPWFFKWKILK